VNVLRLSRNEKLKHRIHFVAVATLILFFILKTCLNFYLVPQNDNGITEKDGKCSPPIICIIYGVDMQSVNYLILGIIINVGIGRNVILVRSLFLVKNVKNIVCHCIILTNDDECVVNQVKFYPRSQFLHFTK